MLKLSAAALANALGCHLTVRGPPAAAANKRLEAGKLTVAAVQLVVHLAGQNLLCNCLLSDILADCLLPQGL